MYRVLIVDDEPVIRNGISSFIDWEREGVTVEDHFANGAEALVALEDRPFDILITDIKMPLINGIQLMKRAMELHPSLKVILISNYSDFEYVKEGLKLGAVDYLLKLTLKKDDLVTVLRQAIAMLEEERRQISEQGRSKESVLYLKRKQLEQDVRRLIVQEGDSGLSPDWPPEWLDNVYVCGCLMVDSAEEWMVNYGYLHTQLMLDELQMSFYKEMETGIALQVSESSMFLVFPQQEGEAERRLVQWKQSMEKELELSASIGFTVKQGSGSLLAGYADSRLACQKRFFEGQGGLYRMDGPERQRPGADSGETHDWTPFFDLIRNGDPVSSAIELALERWKGGGLSPDQVKQEACRLVAEAYHLRSGGEAMPPERLDRLQHAETLEQLASMIKHELEEMEDPYMPIMEHHGQDAQLITKAIEYIAAHYTENITLQDVADIVQLNKSYVSYYFKKQTGRNFIDYLIDLRIREAKRLLAQNEKRIYEVAAAAGFKDVKHFSKMFKKVTGLSPVEYRQKHRARENS